MVQNIRYRSVVVAALGLLFALVLTPWSAAQGATPAQCPKGGAKISASDTPASVSVVDTRTGDKIPVTVRVTGSTLSIAPIDGSTTLTDAAWCLKAGTRTQTGSGILGANTTITNANGVPRNISYVTVYSVTSQGAAFGQCWAGSNDGQITNDVKYIGPENTVGNGAFYASKDGTCTGDLIFTVEIVTADTQPEAVAICSELIPPGGWNTMFAYTWQNGGYPSAPSNLWFCDPFLAGG